MGDYRVNHTELSPKCISVLNNNKPISFQESPEQKKSGCLFFDSSTE